MKATETDMPYAKDASPAYRDHVKRIVDLTIAVPVFVVAAIPMAITALAVKMVDTSKMGKAE